ncbi:GMC oxidoreductase [Plantibacter flavus]|uniref:GMC oxidoreductase n=1 Tax=Plantibacter flavus TaxID=150123 RepID=UPI0013563011|nr:GMC oxidoreductase [Plantibacter flavus]
MERSTSSAEGTASGRARLATDDLPEECGVAVIGSGFGGSVIAARLAGAVPDGELVVLERGIERVPGEFPNSFASMRSSIRTRRNPFGLFELHLGRDVDRLTACGLGGGSLIYANVLLEPRPEVFDDSWPSQIDLDTLAPYYDRVRSMLQPEVYVDEQDVRDGGPVVTRGALRGSAFERVLDDPNATGRTDWAGRTFDQRRVLGKVRALSGLAEKRGAVAMRVPVAINLTSPAERNAHGVGQPKCTMCGNCVTGCNVGAKTTMWASYLRVARTAGARIVTAVEVRTIVPSTRPDRRWMLRGRRWLETGGRRRAVGFELHCDVAVLGAGALGTTGILLRSAAAGLPVAAGLGRRFSGNADALAVSYNSAWRQSGTGAPDEHQPDPEPGPTITTELDRRTPEGGYLLQDGAMPNALTEALRRILALRFAFSGDRRIWCDLRPGGCPPGCGAIEHSQVWLAMGSDSAEGTVGLDRRGEPRVRWVGSGKQSIYAQEAADLAQLSDGAGATHVSNPRHALLSGGIPSYTPITVHPLGGAAMSDDPATGACDADGRVYRADGSRHEGLYVADGSGCPSATGANPALTIAALAERIASTLLNGRLAALTRLRPATTNPVADPSTVSP